MSAPDLWVMTCAPASRQEEVEKALDFAGVPRDHCVLVTTQPDPITEFDGHLLLFDSEEINLSKWWNLALDHIEKQQSIDVGGGKFSAVEINPYDVVWLSSDVLFHPNDIEWTRHVMREEDCIMAGPDWHGSLPAGDRLIRRDNTKHELVTRIPGIAFVIAGETGIRADEEFRWWLADDDFEWTHRVNGGTVLIADASLMHLTGGHPLDSQRLVAWHEDLEKFRTKWNDDPFHGRPPL
jgi:hypothetical protein